MLLLSYNETKYSVILCQSVQCSLRIFNKRRFNKRRSYVLLLSSKPDILHKVSTLLPVQSITQAKIVNLTALKHNKKTPTASVISSSSLTKWMGTI